MPLHAPARPNMPLHTQACSYIPLHAPTYPSMLLHTPARPYMPLNAPYTPLHTRPHTPLQPLSCIMNIFWFNDTAAANNESTG